MCKNNWITLLYTWNTTVYINYILKFQKIVFSAKDNASVIMQCSPPGTIKESSRYLAHFSMLSSQLQTASRSSWDICSGILAFQVKFSPSHLWNLNFSSEVNKKICGNLYAYFWLINLWLSHIPTFLSFSSLS